MRTNASFIGKLSPITAPCPGAPDLIQLQSQIFQQEPQRRFILRRKFGEIGTPLR